MVGRVTLEKDFTEGKKPVLVKASKPIKREAFIDDKHAASFAIAVDVHGKLGWKKNEINGDHVEILSELISDEYLQYLQNKKVYLSKHASTFNRTRVELKFPLT